MEWAAKLIWDGGVVALLGLVKTSFEDLAAADDSRILTWIQRGAEKETQGWGREALALESMVCSFSQLYLVLLLYSAKQYLALLGLVCFAVLLAGNLTVDPSWSWLAALPHFNLLCWKLCVQTMQMGGNFDGNQTKSISPKNQIKSNG